MPKTLESLIRHLCVDNDTYNNFISWLSDVYMGRENPIRIWGFHGTQSTGKTFLFHQVLRPLLGSKNTVTIYGCGLNAKSYGDMVGKTLICIDDLSSDEMRNRSAATAVLRKIIATNGPYLILAANTLEDSPFDPRTHTTAPAQHSKLPLSTAELQAALDNDEVGKLAKFFSGLDN